MASNGSVEHPSISGIRLVFGGNVFGWTADRDRSFALLDAFYEAGGRMIDTAEIYSAWVPGHKGGESETIIGSWLESRNVRTDMRIATKTGLSGKPDALSPDAVAAALDASLERLRTDYVDLYYIHRDDETAPLDEMATAFDAPFRAGKVRELGASNFSAERLAALNHAAAQLGAQPFTVLQPKYNLVARDTYEGALQDLCVEKGIAVFPYYGLAAGFLSGKYTSAKDWDGRARANSLDEAAAGGGWDVLDRVRSIAQVLGIKPAHVALAWLAAQPGIAAPLVSATSLDQLAELIAATRVDLDATHLAALSAATV